MEAAYAERYGRLYRQHFWWRARERMLLELIDALDFPRGGNVLDVGCGDGLFFSRLERYGRVYGVESDPNLVPEQSRHRGAIHVGPFDANYAPRERFSLIVMLDVLESTSDRPAAALTQARGLLAAGGALVITVPAFRLLWSAHDEWNQHRTRFTANELARLTDSAGLRIERSQYFFHWLFVVKLAGCAYERLFGTRPEPADVPARFANSAAYALSRVEQRMFARHPLPFGSSLCAVVRP